jgi:peptidoglycan/xylan/chitin deacetylase (PgdA/CDA1 family)
MAILKIGVLLLASLVSFNALADSNAKTLPSKGTVALTFDDGPNDTFTPQILAILKKYNVKATFFMVGQNAKTHPDMVKRVYAEGHAVNSHSQTHAFLPKLNDKNLHNEIHAPKVIIYQILGKNVACLRYPYGASNEHVRQEIRNDGMIPVPMGFNSFDYDRPGVDKIVSWVLKNAHSGQVILMHDGFAKREQTVAALPRIIEGIQKKGLGFSQICKD